MWIPLPITAAVVDVNIVYLPKWTQVAMAIRTLRPLHALSIIESVRDVVRQLLRGWKNFAIAGAIMVGFLFMFANLAVQVSFFPYNLIFVSLLALHWYARKSTGILQ